MDTDSTDGVKQDDPALSQKVDDLTATVNRLSHNFDAFIDSQVSQSRQDVYNLSRNFARLS